MADGEQSEQARRAARTYGAASDHYCLPSLSFWDEWGAATVSQLGLTPGDAVLDLCCGAGASAIPAAAAVSPSGRVLGIDLAEPMLELARGRARSAGLSNVEFRQGDGTRTGFSDDSFDAVVCVFGVFFAADMAGFVAEMWRLVRPGGKLAITTWGPGWCEPASSRFWGFVRDVEPSLFRAYNPWDEITTPAALAELFDRADVDRAVTRAQAREHRLADPADFWDIVLGSGLRGTVDVLSPEQRETVRGRLLESLRAGAVTSVRTDVVFGLASRPPE